MFRHSFSENILLYSLRFIPNTPVPNPWPIFTHCHSIGFSRLLVIMWRVPYSTDRLFFYYLIYVYHSYFINFYYRFNVINAQFLNDRLWQKFIFINMWVSTLTVGNTCTSALWSSRFIFNAIGIQEDVVEQS